MAGYVRVLANPAPRAAVTRRELQFLRLAANGNTNAQIAAWSGVSASTVNTLLRKVYRKLGVSDRAQAVAVALRLELIRLDEITLPNGPGGPQGLSAVPEAPTPRRGRHKPPQTRPALQEAPPCRN
jgi:DNA-binding CsgD family transcriptional regulator